MSVIDVVGELIGKCYINKKFFAEIQQVRDETGLQEIDWNQFLEDVSEYPIEVQTVVEAPNEDHVKLYDHDIAEIDRIQAETRSMVEREIPECLMQSDWRDGIISFHTQTHYDWIWVDKEAKKLEEHYELSNRLYDAAPNLYGASCGRDIQMDAQSVFNNFLTLKEDAQKNVRISQKGKTGEERVSRILRQYQDRFFSLENIVIPSPTTSRKTAETDAYIISNKGVFVCEVKNYGSEGQTLYMPESGDWKLLNERGVLLANKDSAFEQNERHCIATRDLIKEQLGISVPIIPVVIIANNEVDVENASHNIVIRAEQIYDLVSSYQDAIDYETQKKIMATLEENQLDPNDFPVKINADRAKYVQELFSFYIPYLKANAKIANIRYKYFCQVSTMAKVITLLLAVISMIPVLLQGEWLIVVYGIIAWGMACTTHTKIGTISGIVAVTLLPLWLITWKHILALISILSLVLCYYKGFNRNNEADK